MNETDVIYRPNKLYYLKKSQTIEM